MAAPDEATAPDEQLAWEAARRTRAAAAAVGAGLLTLGGGIISQLAVVSDYPSIGVVQAIEPALRGQAEARVDPRSAQIAFLDDNAAGLVLSALVLAIGTLLMGYVLHFLFRAAKARRPEVPGAIRWLVVVGPATVALFALARQVITVVNANDFVSGTDRSQEAVDAVQDGGLVVAVELLALLGQFALALSFVLVGLHAMRAGLLTRFMGVLGIIVGVLFIIPIGSPLPIVQTFWLIALAPLLALRWPSGQPPAWITGRAEPWPSQQQLRERRDAERNREEAQAIRDRPARSELDELDVAEPVRPEHARSRKRKGRRR